MNIKDLTYSCAEAGEQINTLSHPCMPPSESPFCLSYQTHLYLLPWIAVTAPSDSRKTCITLYTWRTIIKQYICSVLKKTILNNVKYLSLHCTSKYFMNSEPFQQTHTYANGCSLTSRWPLKEAWCKAVRPARSDTLTLLSSGTNASAQRTALLAAATCRGVCQFLSRAFTSAECFSKTCTASCRTQGHRMRRINYMKHYFSFVPLICGCILSQLQASHNLSIYT